MATLITGRGVVRVLKDDTTFEDKVEDEDNVEDENVLISIEEYRKMKFTDEQEWNNSYNPKRSSIEALNYIEIKKRGDGAIKNIYKSFNDTEYGPYYDPIGVHLCVWKNNKLIKNFKCGQDPSYKNIQSSSFKPGLYCAICHKRKESTEFDWSNSFKVPKEARCAVPYENIIPVGKCTPCAPLKRKLSNSVSNWNRLMIKCIHALYNDIVVYNISKYESKLLWPWQMTYYQKFKHSNPNYKDSVVFLASDMENFRDNYGVIE